MYSDYLFKEAINDGSGRLIRKSQTINNIQYADDTAIIATTSHGLQKMLQDIRTVSKSYGLKINLKKTKIMVIKKTGNGNIPPILINNTMIEWLRSCQYLGTQIEDNSDQTSGVNRRIKTARTTFIKIKQKSYTKILA